MAVLICLILVGIISIFAIGAGTFAVAGVYGWIKTEHDLSKSSLVKVPKKTQSTEEKTEKTLLWIHIQKNNCWQK